MYQQLRVGSVDPGELVCACCKADVARGLQVAMLFPHSFWGGLDMFGRIAPCVARRGEYFLFYSYTHISGGESAASMTSDHHPGAH